MKEEASKHIDGIADLVVIAPIKDGFINAFEAITYTGRLKLVAEALNRLRIAAREHERLVPFSDVTERILSLLDFRVGIIDKDMFGLAESEDSKLGAKPTRYLYLTATFDGGFEPYMRQIWQPLGPFLDLLFCNCEGYITATEHSFEEYLQWVRDNQIESAIFYSTTGLTVRDEKYLTKLERVQRSWNKDFDNPNQPDPEARDAALTRLTMPYPEEEAFATRMNGAHLRKTLELGFEALNVLFKLADFYPPEWMTGPGTTGGMGNEGHRLIRATREILRGWEGFRKHLDALIAKYPDNDRIKEIASKLADAEIVYAEPLNWFRTGSKLFQDYDAPAPEQSIPELELADVQAGILKPHGSKEKPVHNGALMMFTVRDAVKARQFIATLVNERTISFEGDGHERAVHANIAFTQQGLLHLAMYRDTLDRFPKEFREGPAQRSGILGDMRENHPRNWILPERNGPTFTNPDTFTGIKLPRVELDEVDFVIQLRGTDKIDGALRKTAQKIAKSAGDGATLEAIDWLHAQYDKGGRFIDHLGFLDGISQPKPEYKDGSNAGLQRDRVALGEVLQGYTNNRGDAAPDIFSTLDANKPGKLPDTYWRQKPHHAALKFQKNGSYLVIRKIGTDTGTFNEWLDSRKSDVAAQLGCTQEKARDTLKAAVMGRDAGGKPLVTPAPANINDFDYVGDMAGSLCPHAAHIRRANPRKIETSPSAPVETRAEFNRPTPRLLRRGMLFGGPTDSSKGLMFMAYAASIAEQYEVIQRWLNGGNSTDVSSANNDILTGVQPKEGAQTFRFMAKRKDPETGTEKEIVIRVPLPLVHQTEGRAGDPGRHPFAPLYWGLYLFSPSKSALLSMAKWEGIYIPIEEMKEEAIGNRTLTQFDYLPEEEKGKEWKRVIEDFVTRDPSEQDISPHVWSTIRWNYGGAYNINGSVPFLPATSDKRNSKKSNEKHDWSKPNWKKQNIIICAGHKQVMQVLAQWKDFTSEDQLRRIKDNAGPIYVTQQPDNKYMYNDLHGKKMPLDYHKESQQTNAALFAYSQTQAFKDGYNAGNKILNQLKGRAIQGPDGPYFKIELKREYFQPAIAEIWRLWYGLPDDKNEALQAGGWSWKRIVSTITEGNSDTERVEALCPGDFMAPSRAAVFPRPGKAVQDFADMQGKAILEAGRQFVKKYRGKEAALKTNLIRKLFTATPATPGSIHGDEVLARNVIGTMIGAIPPMDANLRNITLEWLLEKSLWRNQAAMKRAMAGRTVLDSAEAVQEALRVPISQAICKRPAPDVLYRTAKGKSTIKLSSKQKERHKLEDVRTKEGDLVAVSLVSASQWSLASDKAKGTGDVSVIFGGNRQNDYQGYVYANGQVKPDPKGSNNRPAHACPAQKMAIGGMTGIMAALLDAGTIQALPASLIVRISDW